MISQIFADARKLLRELAESETHEERVFRLALAMGKRLEANQIRYYTQIKDGTAYFVEFGDNGEIVVLDLNTGKYTVIDREEYRRRYV